MAFKIANEQFRREGIPVLVLDPDLRKDWNADFITDDPDHFLAVVKANRRCALFIDEGGITVGRYPKEMEWTATNSRKWGHRAFFIAQRASQISPTVRGQCVSVLVFRQATEDAKILAREFVSDKFKEASTLAQGEYIAKIGFDGQPYKGKAW
jgi:hypothetical protein